MISFIIKHYQIGRVHAEFLNDVNFKATFTIVNSEENNFARDLCPQTDIKPILYNSDYEDHLEGIILNTIYPNQHSIGVKENIEAILKLINLEINIE